MLECRDLVLQVGAFRLRADLTLPGTGIVAVMGPSGGGKSTFLAALAGFESPAQGAILWQGRDLTGVAPNQRPISLLFQDNNLFPHLTLAQNAGLGIAPRLRLTGAETARVTAMLGRLGLAGLAGRRPGDVSGGQAARAALAWVLLADRPVIAMDEPFAALGPALRAEMLALVRAETQGRLVLMVTHDPQDARAIAGSMVVVAENTVSGPFPVPATLDNPPPALAAYLGRPD